MSSLDKVAGLEGWRWLFLIEGLPTTVFGIACFFLLCDRPADAQWLTDSQKELVERVLRADIDKPALAGGGARQQMRKALADTRVWVLAFIYFACAVASYVFTFWLPTMIKDLGVSGVARIGWYAALPGIFSGAGVLLITRSSDRFGERRWHVGGSLIVAAILLLATTMTSSSLASGLAILCVCGFFLLGAAIAYWSIPPTYLSPDTAAVGIALISSIGVIGGFIGPTLLGVTKEATGGFAMGIAIVAGIMIAGGLTTIWGLPRSATRVGASI
jgi:predicted MFS family arabinose efflux permease